MSVCMSHAESCITYIQVYICVDVDFLVVWIQVMVYDIMSKMGKILMWGV